MSQSKFKATNLLAGTALVALGVAFAGQVSAKDHARVIKSGKDQVSLSISGHVSRQITIVDDGRTSVRHSDSDFSSSRIVLKGKGKINSDLSVATKIETAVDDARNGPAQADTEHGSRSGNDLQTRKAEISLKHKSFGTVWMGAGDTATNGITEHSFVSYAFLPGFYGGVNGGAFRAVDADGNGAQLRAVNDVIGYQDGLGRSTRIRYDSPVIAGFMASTSHLDDQSWDVALRYNGKVMGTKIKAGIGFSNDSTDEQLAGSIALLHSSGLGARYGIEHVNDETRGGEGSANAATATKDFVQQGAQLFYTSKFNEMGKTQIMYDYTHAENKNASGDVADGHSFAVAQNIDAAAMELIVRFTTVELNNDALTLDNDTVNSLSIHTRVKF
jgi:predicted porin